MEFSEVQSQLGSRQLVIVEFYSALTDILPIDPCLYQGP